MSQRTDRGALRVALQGAKQEREEQVRRIRSDVAAVSGGRRDVGDETDGAQAEVTDATNAALSDRLGQQIAAIGVALGRLDTDPSFGLCRECEREIEEKRLKAIPWATKCRECQQAEEAEQASPAPRIAFDRPFHLR